MTLSEVNVDYFGNLRDGFMDMGAYEFSSTSTVFSDVHTGYSETLGGVNYPLYSYIMALYNAGYTAGCSTNTLKFCPWDQLTREAASVFGLWIKYGSSYMPPAATGTVFEDITDANYWSTDWAEQAYKDNLLPACGTGTGGKPLFCPYTKIDRAWAAYMIVIAKGLPIE